MGASLVWGGQAIEFASWIAGIGSLALAAAALLAGRPAESAAAPTLIVSGIEDQTVNPDDDAVSLRYKVRHDDARLLIEPQIPYISRVRDGGELTPLDYWHSPWEGSFHWPILDIKIVNNSNRTVLCHQAVFHVRESRPDLRPIPVLRGVTYGTFFTLLNLGWGPMTNCSLHFQLRPPSDPTDGKGFETYFEVPAGGHATVPLEEQFLAVGVDVPLLTELNRRGGGYGRYDAEYETLRRRALGPFPRGWVELIGTLQYDQIEIDGSSVRRANPIRSLISLNDPLAGAPLPPSHEYLVQLRSDGQNYSETVQVSHSLAPGESDRFLINIAADRSSIHELSLQLRYNDDGMVASGPINLALFRSTADQMPARPVDRELSDGKWDPMPS
ncbi:hypothetical protein ONA91_17825 [Micromonospora sp. DR5-3]|uniref:hypothetical protein n=1 Tax=unclassified Micromonospora TaxID=2617518 RepID=UPI0011D679E0|nr:MULTISPECIES: hypothetical protein [unclassified Micromonospora]MCW3816306.1 hypothetical protein [Micromonospora sp. DR5-3]TYC23896.1 hypothetical protein FXF52_12665 [Micromonospora sp. MP36]